MRDTILPLLLGAAALPPAVGQDLLASTTPADAAAPLATYRDGPREVTVTCGDVALEMAFHLRRKDDGRAGCAQLVKTALVRRAAARAGIAPARAEVEARWRELRAQLRAAGRDVEREPIFRNTSEATWLGYLAVDLAHEQLVRRELSLRADEQVSPAMLQLWVKEARARAAVEDDPDQLPAGTVARVDGEAILALDLGMLLLRTSDQDTLDKFVRQVVVLQRLEAMARERKIDPGRADLERALAQRRAAAQSDPRFRGLPFEQLLQSQGLTVGSLLESRVFRGQVSQQQLVAAMHPRAELQAELDRDRATVLATFGPRRHLAIVFVRALEPPNDLVPRDFAAATALLQEARQRLPGEPFEQVARACSEDGSRANGGDVGWHARAGTGLPPPVLQAAWLLPVDAVSDPVRAGDGCYLVKVLAVEPDLADAVVLDRMREQRVDALTVEILRAAAIARTDGTPLPIPGDLTAGNGGK